MRLPWRARESATWWPVAARAWPNRRSNCSGRFTQRVIVNYDPDTAGQTATERSLAACWSRISKCACWRCRDRRQESRPGFIHPRKGRGRLHQAAEGSAALCGLLDCRRAADGFDDRRRKTARGEFSFAVRAENSQPHSALGMGHAHRAAACAWTSRCCARR